MEKLSDDANKELIEEKDSAQPLQLNVSQNVASSFGQNNKSAVKQQSNRTAPTTLKLPPSEDDSLILYGGTDVAESEQFAIKTALIEELPNLDFSKITDRVYTLHALNDFKAAQSRVVLQFAGGQKEEEIENFDRDLISAFCRISRNLSTNARLNQIWDELKEQMLDQDLVDMTFNGTSKLIMKGLRSLLGIDDEATHWGVVDLEYSQFARFISSFDEWGKMDGVKVRAIGKEVVDKLVEVLGVQNGVILQEIAGLWTADNVESEEK